LADPQSRIVDHDRHDRQSKSWWTRFTVRDLPT